MKYLAWFIAFSMGYLSLSQEILWTRFIGFWLGGHPLAFSLVLCFFLAGVAVGSVFGKKICALYKERGNQKLLVPTFFCLLIAGLFDCFCLIVLYRIQHSMPQLGLVFGLIFLAALLKAILFPIAHQIGTESDGDKVGRSLSRVYCMNIAGSTLGPLVTGFVLLDMMTFSAVFALIAVLTLSIAIVVLAKLKPIAIVVLPGVFVLFGLSFSFVNNSDLFVRLAEVQYFVYKGKVDKI